MVTGDNNPYTIQYTTSTDSDAIASKLIQAIVDLAKNKVDVGAHASLTYESSKYFRKLLRDYLFEPSDIRSVSK